MAIRKGGRDRGNEPGTQDGTIGLINHHLRYACWEDVPDPIRVEVDSRLAAYEPAPLNPDGSIAWDQLAPDDDRGRLHLDRSGIDDTALALLVRERVAHLKALREIRVGNNQITGVGLAALAPCFLHLRNLHTLRLGFNKISDAGLAELVPCFQRLTALRVLGLSGNQITDSGLAKLAPCFQHLTALEVIGLSGNRITDAGLATVAAWLPQLTALRMLRLENNQITGVGLAELAPRLHPLAALQELGLDSNQISDAGLAELAPCIQNFRALEVLGLSGNRISDTGLAKLATCFKNLASLQKLRLGGNRITGVALGELAPSFQHLAAVRELGLGGNQISDAGLAEITPCLRYLTALQKLRLQYNQISDAAAVVRLIEMFKSGDNAGGTLTELVVDDNPLAFKAADGTVNRVPPEALTGRNPEVLLGQLRRYATAELKPLYCLRATVLGRQQVGKSHLALRLANGGKLPTDQTGKTDIPDPTADWELHTLMLEDIVLPGDVGMRNHPVAVELRLLDFGGDPELHSAHRLLLRDRRNFYIIVCDASTDREASLLDYWLRVAGAYGSRTETVWEAENESARAIDRQASAIAVLSWCDRPVHADFSDLNDSMLRQKHGVNVRLVSCYWEPMARNPGTPPRGRRFVDAIEEIRKSILACVVEQAHELGIGYPTGFIGVIDAFDPLKPQRLNEAKPLYAGPMPLADVEAEFVKATGNALDGRTGAELLCNLGLAVCPKLDADYMRQDWERARLPAASADAVKLTNELVFGSQWLKKLIYKVVRRTGNPPHDKRGVVQHSDLMQMLQREIGGPNAAALAECVRALLVVNRMIFPRDESCETYLVPERLPDADSVVISEQVELFAGAFRWTLKPVLLLASHLAQFFAEEYSELAAADDLHGSVYRNIGKLRWHENPEVEALLTAHLNRGTIDIDIRGTDDVGRAEHFARAIVGSWSRVIGRRGLEGKLFPANAESPRQTLSPARVVSRAPDVLGGREGLPTAPRDAETRLPVTEQAEARSVAAAPTSASHGRLRGPDIAYAILAQIEKDDAHKAVAQRIRLKWSACNPKTFVSDYCDAVKIVVDNYAKEFDLRAVIAKRETEVDASAFKRCLEHGPLLQTLRRRLAGRTINRSHEENASTPTPYCFLCGFCGALHDASTTTAKAPQACRECGKPFFEEDRPCQRPNNVFRCSVREHAHVSYAVEYAHRGRPEDQRKHGGCLTCRASE